MQAVYNNTWAPHVIDTWCEWSAKMHPAVTVGTWVAPLGTVERSYTHNGQLTHARVGKLGLHMHVKEATNFWFPARSATGVRDVVHANLDTKRFYVYGDVQPAKLARIARCIDKWTGHPHGFRWHTTAV